MEGEIVIEIIMIQMYMWDKLHVELLMWTRCGHGGKGLWTTGGQDSRECAQMPYSTTGFENDEKIYLK